MYVSNWEGTTIACHDPLHQVALYKYRLSYLKKQNTHKLLHLSLNQFKVYQVQNNLMVASLIEDEMGSLQLFDLEKYHCHVFCIEVFR